MCHLSKAKLLLRIKGLPKRWSGGGYIQLRCNLQIGSVCARYRLKISLKIQQLLMNDNAERCTQIRNGLRVFILSLSRIYSNSSNFSITSITFFSQLLCLGLNVLDLALNVLQRLLVHTLNRRRVGFMHRELALEPLHLSR